ncbi:DUF502 domain-containing protein [Piscinibacter sakaiensis]|uniref:Transporter n=1 Tax=Piscinibacter sakaiensis TaxID=1547922 RepID=A0A0K8NTR8_PISS1|nr:DUF502 domain-containing protein [Piscinibacter sakaiensis]GAP33782.1 hypothetical protein ISF6_1037 [Piscinibacter sakaiensis]
MTDPARRLLRTFLTGLLAALPLIATVAVLVWAARLLYDWLGPGSLVGHILVAIGFGGVVSEVVGYLLGVCIVCVAIFALGLLVQSRMHGVPSRLLNGVLQRIPVVRNVYDLAKKFVDLLAQRDASQTRSMRPVWLSFGGPGGAAVLGLLSTPEPVSVGGRAYVGVLVPTAPVPVGGGLLYVPQEWVHPAEIGVDGLTSIYVSMGITSSQHLGAAIVPGGPTPGPATDGSLPDAVPGTRPDVDGHAAGAAAAAPMRPQTPAS